MPRYIDAIKLLKEFQALPCCPNGYSDEYDKARIFAMIDNQPIADVVEVVRCKDCRFYLKSNEKCELVDTRLRFYDTDKTWTGECFCSWGERREKQDE